MTEDLLAELAPVPQVEPEDLIQYDPWLAVDGLSHAFNHLLYSSRLWHTIGWRGLQVWKWPTDLWAYMEIIEADRPQVIVEAGTHTGGSAVFFADMMGLYGLPEVVTIDTEDRDPPAHQGVTYLRGSSTDPAIIERVHKMVGGRRCMVSLDSLHTYEHVTAELAAYADLVEAGQHLVVEDSGWAGSGPLTGARQATEDFRATEEGARFEVDHARTRFMLTQSVGGYLLAGG